MRKEWKHTDCWDNKLEYGITPADIIRISLFQRKINPMFKSLLLPQEVISVGFRTHEKTKKTYREGNVKYTTFFGASLKGQLRREIKLLKSGSIHIPQHAYDKGLRLCHLEYDAQVYDRVAQSGLHWTEFWKDEIKLLNKVMVRLTERERTIIKCRYLLSMTLQETSEILGLTRERIRQIQNVTIYKIKKIISEDYENFKSDEKVKAA